MTEYPCRTFEWLFHHHVLSPNVGIALGLDLKWDNYSFMEQLGYASQVFSRMEILLFESFFIEAAFYNGGLVQAAKNRLGRFFPTFRKGCHLLLCPMMGEFLAFAESKLFPDGFIVDDDARRRLFERPDFNFEKSELYDSILGTIQIEERYRDKQESFCRYYFVHKGIPHDGIPYDASADDPLWAERWREILAICEASHNTGD